MSGRGRLRGSAMRVLLAAAIAGGFLAHGPRLPGAAAAPGLTPVGSFDAPIYVTAPAGDARRLFVVERGGRIMVVRDGETLARPFLTIPGGVSTAGEGGLLSMAFHPDYQQNRRFYVLYTRLTKANPTGGVIRVDEFRRRPGDPNRAIGKSQRPVITIPHSTASHHYGGQLQFGSDGHLYISTGDGGVGPSHSVSAQDLESLSGKILRIDPTRDADSMYQVPPDNPFVGVDGLDEIWAYGLRNPFRFSFDQLSGNIAVGDVGEGGWEEVDFRRAEDPAGANFGWDCFEGSQPYEHATSPPPCLNPKGAAHVAPVLEYAHRDTDPCNSITGGYVIRDPSLETLRGRYIYGDYCTGDIDTAVLRASGARRRRDLGLDLQQFSLVSFGEDGRGHMHVVSIGDGNVYRLTD